MGSASAAVSGALSMLDYANTVYLIYETLEVNEALRKQFEDSSIIIHEGFKVRKLENPSNLRKDVYHV
ncbi:MAG: hypothetical protein PVG70_04900 [Desulfobacterales bacterium]